MDLVSRFKTRALAIRWTLVITLCDTSGIQFRTQSMEMADVEKLVHTECCCHRARTVTTISAQTPVNHPKMHPPKQPFGWLLLFPRDFWILAAIPWGLRDGPSYFLEASRWLLSFPTAFWMPA